MFSCALIQTLRQSCYPKFFGLHKNGIVICSVERHQSQIDKSRLFSCLPNESTSINLLPTYDVDIKSFPFIIQQKVAKLEYP